MRHVNVTFLLVIIRYYFVMSLGTSFRWWVWNVSWHALGGETGTPFGRWLAITERTPVCDSGASSPCSFGNVGGNWREPHRTTGSPTQEFLILFHSKVKNGVVILICHNGRCHSWWAHLDPTVEFQAKGFQFAPIGWGRVLGTRKCRGRPGDRGRGRRVSRPLII